jgi:membrane complex biogenesis BtpA family protein
MTSPTQSIFGVDKPVIAMAHLPALPGTPRYDPKSGLDGILTRVESDVRHLLAGGVDAILFCNEDDRPYTFHAGFEAVAVMTSVITQLRPKDRPFGVDFLWDPMAPLAIAKATGAGFIREVVSGVYESDMGIWTPDSNAIYRYRRQIDAEKVKIFANITPEFASTLGSRSAGERARSLVVSTLVDAVLVSGVMAGSEPQLSTLQEVMQALAGYDVPVFLNTGAKAENIQRYLAIADGVIVGSSLKVDGYTWNPVEPARVRSFMEQVREVRAS